MDTDQFYDHRSDKMGYSLLYDPFLRLQSIYLSLYGQGISIHLGQFFYFWIIFFSSFPNNYDHQYSSSPIFSTHSQPYFNTQD